MKKILAILLAVMMLTTLAVLPATAEGADPLGKDMKVLGYQVSASPTSSDANDNYYAIRIVAAHNNVDEYFQFGYSVTIQYTENGTEQTKTLTDPIMSSIVYKELYAKNNDKIDLDDYSAEYFSAVEITDIPVTAGDLSVTVTPIVVYSDARGTANGTPVAFTHDFTTLTTMTFNINNWEESDAHLSRIKAVIKDADKGNYPDVIGFQEMSNLTKYEWVARFMADTEIASTYEAVGESCGDSTGEQCTIFYNENKFELVESGTRWLWCEHGLDCSLESCANGSETAGNFPATSGTTTYYRIMTYAKLRCKNDSNKEFAFINTHLDLYSYESDTYGLAGVHNKQIEYVLNFAKTFTDAGTPVILVGDFNARDEAFGTLGVTPSSTVLQDIVDAGFVRTEKATPEARTFGGEIAGEYFDGDTLMSPGIDHIFVHAENLYCLTYTFCDDKIDVGGTEDYPSDHIPRIAEYAIW